MAEPFTDEQDLIRIGRERRQTIGAAGIVEVNVREVEERLQTL